MGRVHDRPTPFCAGISFSDGRLHGRKILGIFGRAGGRENVKTEEMYLSQVHFSCFFLRRNVA
jgi:hypothetical protein